MNIGTVRMAQKLPTRPQGARPAPPPPPPSQRDISLGGFALLHASTQITRALPGLALLILVALAACTPTQRQEPSAREVLALGYTTVQLAAETAHRQHTAGLIDDAQRATTKQRLSGALATLRQAQQLTVDGDETTAATLARGALLVAQEIVAELQRREASP